MNKVYVGIGVVLIILGVFYSLLPHSAHTATPLGFGLSHSAHIGIGVIFFIIAAGVLYLGYGGTGMGEGGHHKEEGHK